MLSFRVERELVSALEEFAGPRGVSAYVREILHRHVRSKQVRS